MQNFGRIKNTLNSLLIESIGTKKKDANKIIFKEYIKTIKENKILRTQFLIFNNIENRIDNDITSAKDFIKENISLLDKFLVADINKANEKLVNLSEKISKNLDESYELSNVHDSLGFLISTRKTPFNIDTISDKLTFVATHITTNQPKTIVEVIDLPQSLVSNIMVDKYNERYAELNESERKIFKVVISSNDDEKKQVYKDTVNECIQLINDKLKSVDLDMKEHLLSVKDKLLNNIDVDINLFESNISKLIKLRTSLIND